MKTTGPCSHVWIDPAEPPIQRAPYSPVIDTTKRRCMKPGRVYVCRNCGERIVAESAASEAPMLCIIVLALFAALMA